MKRILLLVTVMTLTLAGCGKEKEEEFVFEYVEDESATTDSSDDTDVSDNSSESNGEKETGAEAIGTLDSYVKSQYSKKGEVTFSFEETDSYVMEYKYDIPMIADGSAVAEEINNEIYSIAKESIDQLEALTEGTAKEDMQPRYSDIKYEAYLNGSILSIILSFGESYTDWTEYAVFNYDVASHEIVENEKLLEVVSLSKEDFIAYAKKTFGVLALNDLDSWFDDSVENDGEDTAEDNSEDDEIWKYKMIPEYISDYANTVSDNNINVDIPMYLDSDGDLCAVTLVYVPAGAGQYFNFAKIENKSIDEAIKKYCEYAEKYHYDGFEKDLMKLWDNEGYEGSNVRKITVSNLTSEQVYFGFDSDDVNVFTMQFYSDNYSDVYTGTIKFDSFDENGLIFAYEMTSKNGELLEGEEEPLSGRFYFTTYYYYDEETQESVSGAVYKALDGEDMLKSDHKKVNFTKSFG